MYIFVADKFKEVINKKYKSIKIYNPFFEWFQHAWISVTVA